MTPANPLAYGGLKLIPGVTRTFSAGREWYVFLEAYERDSAKTRPSNRAAFSRSAVQIK